MATVNNVKNHTSISQCNCVSNGLKKLEGIMRKKKGEDKDAQTLLPTILTGSTVQQHSLLRLSLALCGDGVKESSAQSVTSEPRASFNSLASRQDISEFPVARMIHNDKKPAERVEGSEIKVANKELNLAKNPHSEAAGTVSGSRAAVPVLSVDSTNVTQRVEQELHDVSDKSLANRNDLTIMPQQLAHQRGGRLVEVKESVVMKKDSQKMVLSNSDGVVADRTSVKESANASSNLTYNFSEWGNGHRVNVQIAAQHGMPLVLNPSDNLVQERLADQGSQDDRGQPLWIFPDEQEQQQSRSNKPPKYIEDQK